MPKHLQRELDALQKKILSLSAVVEEQVRSAVRSVEKKDALAAKRIIEYDRNIDLLEIEVEEDCLKIFALYQPVAVDLRFIIAVLKINNDLERIADLASNIADRASMLAETPSFTFDSNLTLMCDKAVSMLRACLDALFKMDAEKALSVCLADDEVDDLNREMVDIVKKGICDCSEHVNEYLLLLSVVRNLERIADHATNIAEDVIYMIKGDIVRHRTGEKA
ncbi:MAG: phosphate signaling complex protein PhoU [Chitinispirillaceae bacterium]|nr:phosphate signaling complex protein PhoU [Chitinispirillaceae bacterium]